MSTETDKPVVKTSEETQEELQREDAPTSTEKVEVAINPRVIAEREIAKSAGERRDEEARERIAGMDPAPEPVATEATTDAAPATDAPATTEAPAPAEAEIDLIVNGKPMKVKASQVQEAGVRALQKDFAADQKLELATRLLEEAKRRAEGQPPVPTGAQPDARSTSGAVQEKSDGELAELLQFGTKEQAATAIAEIRRRDAGAVTQDGLKEFIAKELPAAVSSHLAFHSAVTEAQSTYKDIFADPYLTSLFHMEEHRARQAGDARPHAELYKLIGDGIRTHFKLQATKSDSGPTLEQKREVKAKMPTVPKLASTRIEQTATAPKTREEARDSVIKKMQASRGQGNLNKYR